MIVDNKDLPGMVVKRIREVYLRAVYCTKLYTGLRGKNPPKPIYTKYTTTKRELADFFHQLGTGALHINN
jgi:hypothetical protein